MKKEGFTLIELIVTIAIMGLIGVVISTNMLGLFSNEEDKEYEAFVQKIEDSACMYVETVFNDTQRSNCRTNTCTITIDQLINKGYVADDLIDPTTGNVITSNKSKYKVKVSWVNNVKTCVMNG